ncbi:hypothetical protein DFH07DRAFT_939631 [Mycena maculata]|uniref:Uncharacterized protein n=1 Tax=Mycena maculata TaxID=230809 RepID=A0AAD7JCH9_9AGAR|nr:hypothetical protein DFH07DRAFT_939631 [Mycena maculata]
MSVSLSRLGGRSWNWFPTMSPHSKKVQSTRAGHWPKRKRHSSSEKDVPLKVVNCAQVPSTKGEVFELWKPFCRDRNGRILEHGEKALKACLYRSDGSFTSTIIDRVVIVQAQTVVVAEADGKRAITGTGKPVLDQRVADPGIRGRRGIEVCSRDEASSGQSPSIAGIYGSRAGVPCIYWAYAAGETTLLFPVQYRVARISENAAKNDLILPIQDLLKERFTTDPPWLWRLEREKKRSRHSHPDVTPIKRACDIVTLRVRYENLRRHGEAIRKRFLEITTVPQSSKKSTPDGWESAQVAARKEMNLIRDEDGAPWLLHRI